MIRSLHRRFLWNAYLWACVFLLIVMLIAVVALARYMDTILSTALNDTLRLSVSDPATPAVSARMRIPTYLAVIRQAAPDPEATSLKEGDTVELLRGDLADWTEEEIRKDTNEILESTRRIGFLRHETMCFTVDRTGGEIRIALVEYAGYRSLLYRVILVCILLYSTVSGVLFLLMKTAELRLLRPAERAWANQERFVEDASHEMKTPLSTILSNAELGAGETAEETDRRFSVILSEAHRMKLLITRMLESARIENNAAKRRNFTVFSLSDAVTECALRYEEPLYEHGIKLAYDVDDDLYVQTDEAVLKQVLHILLENAGKYTPRGETVTVSAKNRYPMAQITVRNDGVGIDPNECDAVFERFYRAGEVRTHTEGSYGLGLSIAKNLTEAIGGRIRCRSDGSTYTAFVVSVRLTTKRA